MNMFLWLIDECDVVVLPTVFHCVRIFMGGGAALQQLAAAPITFLSNAGSAVSTVAKPTSVQRFDVLGVERDLTGTYKAQTRWEDEYCGAVYHTSLLSAAPAGPPGLIAAVATIATCR